MSETIVVPDNGNNMNNMLPWLASNGGFGGFGNTIGDLIGLAIVAFHHYQYTCPCRAL